MVRHRLGKPRDLHGQCNVSNHCACNGVVVAVPWSSTPLPNRRGDYTPSQYGNPWCLPCHHFARLVEFLLCLPLVALVVFAMFNTS